MSDGPHRNQAEKPSFVSVTQSFNTTTSMGRLTLNVLLSFAQFEREVTGERIRDKIAASKKKGLWMGGTLPLGYKVVDRKLVVVPEEAETVRLIFERYRDLRSLPALQRDLRERGIVTRERTLATGRKIGGIPLMIGALVSLLRNRTYLGEINHRGASYPAEHEAIVQQQVFEAVQAILEANRQGHREHWRKSNALLLGKVYDDHGNRMTPSYAMKDGVRYRYYVSAALIQGNKADAGSVRRVAAQDMEERVVAALRANNLLDHADGEPREALHAVVDRITIASTEITVVLRGEAGDRSPPEPIQIPWTPPDHNRRRSISAPINGSASSAPPSRSVIRAEARARLLIAIATARQWLDELSRREVLDLDEIAKREGRSERSVRMILSLAFLSPEIVSAAIAGTLPRGLGLSDMTDLPMDWSEQRTALGLAQPTSRIDA